MHQILSVFFGRTTRERLATTLNYVLIGAVVLLALELKWALKSPNPTEWNFYSEQANDELYRTYNTAVPVLSPVVSHRAGIVPGIDEPGPLARLTHNYASGQRLFELDIAWTADDELVIKHDWNERSVIPTLDEFLAEAPDSHASLNMVYTWLVEHPDAFIVTDCKKRSLEGCARIRMERPDLVPQFIVQIYQTKDYGLIRSQGFRNIILTMYRCLPRESSHHIADFVAEHPLFALTIPENRSDDAELISRMERLGVPIYVHTINDSTVAKKLRVRGVYGIYSDSMTTADFEKVVAGKANFPGRTAALPLIQQRQ